MESSSPFARSLCGAMLAKAPLRRWWTSFRVCLAASASSTLVKRCRLALLAHAPSRPPTWVVEAWAERMASAFAVQHVRRQWAGAASLTAQSTATPMGTGAAARAHTRTPALRGGKWTLVARPLLITCLCITARTVARTGWKQRTSSSAPRLTSQVARRAVSSATTRSSQRLHSVAGRLRVNT